MPNINLSIEEIQHKILERLPQYRGAKIGLVIAQIKEMDPQVKSALDKYLISGIPPALEIKGYNIKHLVDNYQKDVLEAFLILDYLERDPARAMALIRSSSADSDNNNTGNNNDNNMTDTQDSTSGSIKTL